MNPQTRMLYAAYSGVTHIEWRRDEQAGQERWCAIVHPEEEPIYVDGQVWWDTKLELMGRVLLSFEVDHWVFGDGGN